MKILVVIPSFKPAYIYGGPIYAVSILGTALQSRGHQVSVFTTNANGPSNLVVPNGQPVDVDRMTVYYFKRHTGDHSNFTPQLLKAFWEQAKQFDVIHVHAWWNLVTMPVLLICAIKGIVPILSPRGSITQYSVSRRKTTLKNLFHISVGKKLLERAVIHITADQELHDCRSLFKPLEVFTIPNLHKLHVPLKPITLESNKLNMLYFGRIDPKKNIEFLIALCKDYLQFPHSLNIIGDGDQFYIDKLKEETREITSIIWHDPVHGEEKWQRLANADILLLPSFNENYGNVVIESLSQGTPVLISDHVGLKDYVLKHGFGWVLNIDAKGWNDTLESMFIDPSLRERIRLEAPKAILRDFNTEKLIGDYEALYRHVKHLNEPK